MKNKLQRLFNIFHRAFTLARIHIIMRYFFLLRVMICILLKLYIHNIEFWVFDVYLHEFVAGSRLKAVGVKSQNISIISILKIISSARLLG